MLALKDIKGVRPTLSRSFLSRSAIWNSPVDRIIPAQLFAIRAKMALKDKASEADEAIDYLVRQVKRAVGVGEIPYVPLMRYVRPDDSAFTLSELRSGLEKLKRPKPAAVLFGLEMDLPAEAVVSLTWDNARMLTRSGKLTWLAESILKNQPINIASNYVFWRYHENTPLPLFELEQEVFDVFNMVWAELSSYYARISWVSADYESVTWKDLLLLVQRPLT